VSDQKVCPTCGTEYPLSERFCPRDGTALRSANVSADLLGQVVADRYHILKKLGEGGMGTVYLAEHVKMGRKSALKVMNPGMNTDPDAIARFNREASNASRLSHPNICGIYDFGETPDGLIYLAMEFIEGTSLTDLIEKGGSLPPSRAASIVHQTADALQVAHDAGIVHRDLKPDNIMVAKNRDGTDLVKVVDFGIAKASSSDAQKVTKTGMVVGTPEYMSPEQLSGDKLDGRSDTYSLGLVAFNCITGKLPFPSESAQEAMIMRLTDRPRTLAEMAPDTTWPAVVQETLDRALARDAAERYQSAAQFGRDFAEAVGEMPETVAAEGATMVIGAQSAAASAPTKAIPATRVGAKTPAKGAPAEVAPKRMLPRIAGGGALVAAAVTAWVLWPKTPEATTPPATTPPATTATAPDTQSRPAGTSGTPTAPGTQPLSAKMNPEAGQPRTDPQTTPNTTPTTDLGTVPPPAVNIGQLLTRWRTRLEGLAADTTGSAGIARSAMREIEPLMPSLSGIQLDDARFTLLLAHYTLGNIAEVCRFGSLVQDSRYLAQEQKDLGPFLRGQMACAP
jgi:serine/threonine-protein kinase